MHVLQGEPKDGASSESFLLDHLFRQSSSTYGVENMKSQETLALYQCLSKHYTSDSDLSEVESCLPRVCEVLNSEKLDIVVESVQHQDSKFGEPSKYADFKINETNCQTDLVSGKQCKSKIKNRKQSKNNKKQSREGTELKQSVEISQVAHLTECDASETQETSDEKNSGKIDWEDETTRDYEASEDCTSDDDYSKRLQPKKRKRTTSGSSIPVYECPHKGCGKEFNKLSRMTEHQRQHTGERPHKCLIEGCGRTYTRKQHLRRHMATAHQGNPPEEYLKCEECNELLRNKYSLAKHHFRAHVRQNYKCEECGQSFRKQQHLRTHSYTHTGIEPYRCEYPGCNAGFLVPSKLKRHAIVHAKGRYACPNDTCCQSFDLYNELQKHLAVNHVKACDVCGRTFKQLRQVKAHRKIHEDVRIAFFCPAPNCDSYFYEERNLSKHIREKHEKTMIYQCGICDLVLSSKQKLAYHVTTIHGPSYKRNYQSHNPRKPRKDKGVSRTDFARLLSGYTGEDFDSMELQSMPSSSKDAFEGSSNFKVEASIDSLIEKDINIRGQMENTYLAQQTSHPILSEDDMEKLVLSSDDVAETDSEFKTDHKDL